MNPKILVSACLMGQLVRYNGTLVSVHARLEEWNRKGLILPFCPEVEGGLSVPRPPAEITGGDGSDVLKGRAKIVNQDGLDVTAEFAAGAEKAADLVKSLGICFAILKDGSPSCGNTRIYDGTFTGTVFQGKGVTAARLEQQGVAVFTEKEIDGPAAEELARMSS
jgi:uncharacterized protein YbbK (DUF523 family)